ncbi:MAG: GntR family transcriptional regulator [FCB group bacterium]|jgi:GntR family transcriptional regulator|nr:GntR family transcriptional regulator [FCB group bacterium]
MAGTTNGLSFSVNLDSPIAVYVQIENQVQFAIASGRLKPGDTLPSVREMSSILNVNPNTVTKAYRDLELLQLVHTRRGVGVTVSEKAPKLSKDVTRLMVRSHLKDAVAECIAAGLTASEVKSIVSETIESGSSPYEVGKKGKK